MQPSTGDPMYDTIDPVRGQLNRQPNPATGYHARKDNKSMKFYHVTIERAMELMAKTVKRENAIADQHLRGHNRHMRYLHLGKSIGVAQIMKDLAEEEESLSTAKKAQGHHPG